MAIEKRVFGRTGHSSSAVIFGAAALGKVDQDVADRVLDLLIEHDVNHIDTAASYGDSELRIGPWMGRHRDRFFLATKTGERDYQGARDSIRRSLERLRTDRIDLIQLHALFHPDEWERALGPKGALEACIEARDQGLVKHIGVTGHGWTVAAMHRRSLERFDFDSILLPWNWFAAQHQTYAPDFERTVQLAGERNLAVQTIKGVARGPWAAGIKRDRNTWYQPLEAMDDIRPAVHWVLSRPGVFLLSAGDVALLPSILKAAAEPVVKPSNETMAALSQRTGLASIFGI
ncbi:MAG: aldo/keto reductase [Proteobacteria bacterium]|nr:aldo/keto reductase [Pseudomonadota bacterium]MBI3498258.1 aldo/keto reductase [Pseudomonadota bacterium]